MGVKDGFMGASILMKVACVILAVAEVLNWIAFCTSSWGYSKTPFNPGVGLWRACSENYNSPCTVVEGTRSDWFAAVQAFGIFGFMAVNVAFLLVILGLFVGSCKGNAEVKLGAIILCFVAVVCWLLAVIIFGAIWPEFPSPLVVYKLGFSFGLAIVTFILALIAGILLIVDGKGGGGTSPS